MKQEGGILTGRIIGLTDVCHMQTEVKDRFTEYRIYQSLIYLEVMVMRILSRSEDVKISESLQSSNVMG